MKGAFTMEHNHFKKMERLLQENGGPIGNNIANLVMDLTGEINDRHDEDELTITRTIGNKKVEFLINKSTESDYDARFGKDISHIVLHWTDIKVSEENNTVTVPFNYDEK